jgi:hypothetical protein
LAQVLLQRLQYKLLLIERGLRFPWHLDRIVNDPPPSSPVSTTMG